MNKIVQNIVGYMTNYEDAKFSEIVAKRHRKKKCFVIELRVERTVNIIHFNKTARDGYLYH